MLSVFDRNLARDLQAAPLSSTNWGFWRQHGCWSGLFSSRWGSVSFTCQCKVCGPIVPNSSPKHCAAGGAIFFQCFSQTELVRLRFWYLQQTIFSRTHIKTFDDSGIGNNIMYSQSKPNNPIHTNYPNVPEPSFLPCWILIYTNVTKKSKAGLKIIINQYTIIQQLNALDIRVEAGCLGLFFFLLFSLIFALRETKLMKHLDNLLK